MQRGFLLKCKEVCNATVQVPGKPIALSGAALASQVESSNHRHFQGERQRKQRKRLSNKVPKPSGSTMVLSNTSISMQFKRLESTSNRRRSHRLCGCFFQAIILLHGLTSGRRDREAIHVDQLHRAGLQTSGKNKACTVNQV